MACKKNRLTDSIPLQIFYQKSPGKSVKTGNLSLISRHYLYIFMENIAFFKQNAMKRVSYHNIGHTRFMADFYIRIDYIFLN